eukprot:1594247-Prorocentrum_lima.AAC.1
MPPPLHSASLARQETDRGAVARPSSTPCTPRPDPCAVSVRAGVGTCPRLMHAASFAAEQRRCREPVLLHLIVA